VAIKKFSGLFIAASILFSGCVSPEVVQRSSVKDGVLTCAEIKTQLTQFEEIRTEATKGKTVSRANVAAAILFWPAVIGNYSNAQQALEAANKRNEALVALSNKKRCKFS
tara:strand:+ start:790 stop:1119 length:330 start_codon:yes stop_codon:yes gene_type:complete